MRAQSKHRKYYYQRGGPWDSTHQQVIHEYLPSDGDSCRIQTCNLRSHGSLSGLNLALT